MTKRDPGNLRVVSGGKNELEFRAYGVRLQLKAEADAPAGRFAGYASVFGELNSYGEVVAKGAFRETLGTWKARGKLPPMLLQHGSGAFFGGDAMDLVPVGKWTAMDEDEHGLHVEGRLIAMDTERARTVYAALKDGVLDGLSIGFVPKEWEVGTKADEPRRTLKKVALWEVSLVTFPADDGARLREVRSHPERPEGEAALLRAGFSPGQAATLLDAGFGLHRRSPDADVATLLRHNTDLLRGDR